MLWSTFAVGGVGNHTSIVGIFGRNRNCLTGELVRVRGGDNGGSRFDVVHLDSRVGGEHPVMDNVDGIMTAISGSAAGSAFH
jgi:hypothetical protein